MPGPSSFLLSAQAQPRAGVFDASEGPRFGVFFALKTLLRRDPKVKPLGGFFFFMGEQSFLASDPKPSVQLLSRLDNGPRRCVTV